MKSVYYISKVDIKCAKKLGITFSTHIGFGSYSDVFKAKYKDISIALKIDDKSRTKAHLIEQQLVVINLLKRTEHKNIIKFLDIFENANKTQYWIAMKWTEGVDMCKKIDEKDAPLEECVSKMYFKQMLNGLHFLHSMSIVHRDIKLSNILVTQTHEERDVIKLIDFGFAKLVHIQDGCAFCDSHVGTNMYMAPEVLDLDNPDEEYDAFKTDAYSMGIALFAMIYGCYPFVADDNKTLLELKSRSIEFPTGIEVSSELKELLQNIVCMDCNKRLSIKQIMASKWVQS